MLGIAVTATVVYATHQPGRVEFTTPRHESYTDAVGVTVSGRISNAAVRSISLTLNGKRIPDDVNVDAGEFTTRILLADGRNEIRTLSSNAGVHLLNHSKPLVVHSVEHPGPNRIDVPPNHEVVTSESTPVSGTLVLSDVVADSQLKQIGLRVRGTALNGETMERIVPAIVRGNRFESQTPVPLFPGINRIRGVPLDDEIRFAADSPARFPEHSVYCHDGPLLTEILEPTIEAVTTETVIPVRGQVLFPDDFPAAYSVMVQLAVNGSVQKTIRVNSSDGVFADTLTLLPPNAEIASVTDHVISATVLNESEERIVQFVPSPFDLQISSPANEALLHGDQVKVRACVGKSGVRSMQLQLNNTTQEMTASLDSEGCLLDTEHSSHFGLSVDLQPDRNRLKVSVGSTSSASIFVTTPALLYDFQDGHNQGWKLTGRTPSEEPQVERSADGEQHLISHDEPDIEIVFVVDTSGSMDQELRMLRTDVGDMITRLHRLHEGQNLKIGFVAFASGVRMISPLTAVLSEQEAAVKKVTEFDDLDSVNVGEDIYLGVLRALEPDMHWTTDEGTKRLIAVLTDERQSVDTVEIMTEEGRLADFSEVRQRELQTLSANKRATGLDSDSDQSRLLKEIITKAKRRDAAIHCLLFKWTEFIDRHAAARTDALELAERNRGRMVEMPEGSNNNDATLGRNWPVEHFILQTTKPRPPRRWVVPQAVIDVLSESYGATIEFDSMQTAPQVVTAPFSAYEIVLTGTPPLPNDTQFSGPTLDTHKIVFKMDHAATVRGTRRRIRLVAGSQWRVPGLNNTETPVSETKFREILAGLKELSIRADTHNGLDSSTLDNFAVFRTSPP